MLLPDKMFNLFSVLIAEMHGYIYAMRFFQHVFCLLVFMFAWVSVFVNISTHRPLVLLMLMMFIYEYRFMDMFELISTVNSFWHLFVQTVLLFRNISLNSSNSSFICVFYFQFTLGHKQSHSLFSEYFISWQITDTQGLNLT